MDFPTPDTSPSIFPYKIDTLRRRILFMKLTMQDYHDQSFLDERLGPRPAAWLELSMLDELLPPERLPLRPQGWIFHIGHCGSTLLSRLLSDHPRLLPLREPLALRALAEARRLLDQPEAPCDAEDWRVWLDRLLRLFGRTSPPADRTLVKTTSTCNNLLEPVLESHPEIRAIALYVDLETYLAWMLRSGQPNALWSAAGTRAHDLALLGLPVALYRLTIPELAAVNWLASIALQLDVLTRRPDLAERIRLTDFGAILDAPRDRIEDLALFLYGDRELASGLRRFDVGLLERYAKDQRYPFDPLQRQRELDESRRRHGSLIAHTLAWTERWVARHPLAPRLLTLLRPEGIASADALPQGGGR